MRQSHQPATHRRGRRARRYLLLTAVAAVSAGLTIAVADEPLVSGPNVNMVSGTEWPEGDPYLQRQNEPSLAVSTRNVQHLLAGANDYRSVDIPGLPDGETGDSWLGIFRSTTAGSRWASTLLPGYPQDDSAEGVGSPLKGFDAAADPVVRAGSNGLFYVSGIAFDRGSTPASAGFVARYMDLNNDEGGEPMRYIDTRLFDSDPGGPSSDGFIDKPWIAVDVPRAGALQVALQVPQGQGTVTQTVDCGTVYVAWAAIVGDATEVVSSDIRFSRSIDCGQTWSTPIDLSDGASLNQGAAIAIDPTTGDVHVAWRQFENEVRGAGLNCTSGLGVWRNHPEEWPVTSIIVGGVSYTVEEGIELLDTPPRGDVTYILVRKLIPAILSVENGADDSAATSLIADANQYLLQHALGSKPGGDDKQDGIAIKDQLEEWLDGAAGPGVCDGTQTSAVPLPHAIMVASSSDGGSTFGAPIEISTMSPFDQGTTEYSFRTTAYPTIAVDAASRVYASWSTRGLAMPNADAETGDARVVVSTSLDATTWTTPVPVDEPEIPGHQMQPTLLFHAGQLYLMYFDFREDVSGIFDAFVSDAPSDPPSPRHTVELRVADALPADAPLFASTDVLAPDPSTRVSRYAGLLSGTDQTDLFFEQLQFNPPNLPMFKGGDVPFFGDYMDLAGAPSMVVDAAGNWQFNTAVSGAPVLHAVWTDNRDVVPPTDGDWNTYVPPTHANSGGPSLYDPSESVPVCTPGSIDEQRTGMRNQNVYSSKLTRGLSASAPANFRPIDIERAFALSIANTTFQDRVFRLEVVPPSGGTSASFLPDRAQATLDVEIGANSSIARTMFVDGDDRLASVSVDVIEIDAVGGAPVAGGLAARVVLNQDPTNPAPSDPSLATAEIHNPSIFNPSILNPSILNPSILNPSILNPSILNPSILNPSILNPSILNPSILNPSILNPSILNPSILNPSIFNPSILNPSILNPSILNPSIFNTALEDTSVSEVTYEVRNDGNTTTAYTFNTVLASQLPQSLISELKVYRLYLTPYADGCDLAEEGHQELIVNVPNPEFVPVDLSDPELTNAAVNNTTFVLAPGESALITLTVYDPDTTDSESFDPAEVVAAVVAQPSNTGDTTPVVSQPLTITTASLPDAGVGVPYSETLESTGGSGTPPLVSWAIAEGGLPEGLGIVGDTIVGTPAVDACVLPSSGLRGRWSAEGTAEDSRGGNDGTLLGGAVTTAGYIGDAFTFDGVDDHVRLGDVLDPGAGDLTVATWFSTDVNTGLQKLVNKGLTVFGSPANAGYDLNVRNGTVQFRINDGAGGLITTSAAQPSLNAFHHLAGVLDRAAGTTRLYVDGVLVDEQPIGSLGSVDTNVVLAFGAIDRSPGGFVDEWLSGQMDEVLIYDQALTPSQVATLAGTNPGGRCAFAFTAEASDSGTGEIATRGLTIGVNPDPDVLFFDDFGGQPCATIEAPTWFGKSGSSTPDSAVSVTDPLDPGNCVMTFGATNAAGDAFSTLLTAQPGMLYKIEFDYLGDPSQGGVPGDLGGAIGFSDGLPGGLHFVVGTTLGGDIETDPLIDDGVWRHYSFTFDPFVVVGPACCQYGGGGSFRVMIEDFLGSGGVAGDAYFDNIKVTRVP